MQALKGVATAGILAATLSKSTGLGDIKDGGSSPRPRKVDMKLGRTGKKRRYGASRQVSQV